MNAWVFIASIAVNVGVALVGIGLVLLDAARGRSYAVGIVGIFATVAVGFAAANAVVARIASAATGDDLPDPRTFVLSGGSWSRGSIVALGRARSVISRVRYRRRVRSRSHQVEAANRRLTQRCSRRQPAPCES